ncbi:hypothetical protein D3C86_317420 [compost metagenome]
MRRNGTPFSRVSRRLALCASTVLIVFSGMSPARAQSPDADASPLALSEFAIEGPLQGLQVANLGLRFGLELGALGALGYWGFQVGRGPLETWSLGLGAPTLAALTWATFASAKAAMPVSGPERFLLEVAIFGGATAALAHAGHPGLAKAFALAALVNLALLTLWQQ